MSSNTENTEGKLAAYIDGRLDPAERAQIEQYLAANPEHQRLLAEMTAQRDLLRSLPRDKAPADIYDAIQAQLERSILLDDAAHPASAQVRHSHRSQLFAIAAILTLTVGLGGVLYFVLPSTNPNPTEVAVVPPSPAGETETDASAAVAEDESAATTLPAGTVHGGGELMLATTGQEDRDHTTLAAKSAPVAGRSAGTAIAAVSQPESLSLGVVSNVAPPNPVLDLLEDAGQLEDLAKQLPAVAGPATENRLVVLVSTRNPSHATQQVASYLESNKIHYETLDAPTVTVADGGHQFFARAGDRMARAEAMPAAPAQADAATTFDKSEPAETPAPPTAAAAAPAVEGQAATPTDARVAESRGAQLQVREQLWSAPEPAPQQSESSRADAARPSEQQQQQLDQQTLERLAWDRETKAESESKKDQVVTRYFSELDASAASTSTPRLIIARGMTRQQAEHLTDTLSAAAPVASQRARLLIETPTRQITPARRVSDQTITLSTGHPHTFGGAAGAEASRSLPAQAGDEEYGFSVTSRELAQDQKERAELTPTTHSAGLPTTTTAPATRPDAPDSVDVVILVESDPTDAPLATASPTTAPAPAAEETPVLQDPVRTKARGPSY